MSRPASRDADRLEPPLPLMRAADAEPLTRDQSRMAIGIIIAAILVALGFAMWSLSQLPGLPSLGASGSSTGMVTEEPNGETPGAQTTETPPAAPPPAPPPSTPEPLTFTEAIDYDPLGDGEERPEELPFILDGDAETSWMSAGYASENFAGLKTGLGIILDLGEVSSLSEVTLELPLETTGTIFVSEEAIDRFAIPQDQAEAVGEFTGSGTVSTELAEETSGRYVVVWFTDTTREGDWHRVRLGGASATS
ncbi:MAG: hypothetical protein Q4G67_02950 [Actinomycetia bacterium]|nr:hypothetical protein [Actinomycetes bacterium]